MAIYRRFETLSVSAADQACMATAYELLLVKLRLKDRNDPVTELLANHVIEAFESGQDDPYEICSYVLAQINGLDGNAD